MKGCLPIKDKRIVPLLEQLEEQGWRIHSTKKGWLCYPPDKTKTAVAIHKTPSDSHWFESCLRLLRRSGFRA
ncbi:hypothetical protein E5991_02345 [Bifidobacterium pseudolongum]|uniref:Type II toxin-antitoxin system HicA family toxin n=1 Tax=Bifidobacterium pseudolongum TaxID=1694 RepID=A0A3A9AIT6_9BIFI|nr:hypothetical protein [Bifidobacterium pseudolongum]RKI87403.1 hypothetical protein D7V89_07210 [Bifidobacterium pseudolongum]THG27147.1 hypothetical protein E5991_02345 [Bifidobacterium pseudolongum]